MTQEQADTLIKDWQRKIAAATENLLALDDTLAMKRIEGRDGFPMQPLFGVTASRVLSALVAMRDLFGHIGTIGDVIDRASRKRQSLNRLWRYAETLLEIEQLLSGPSIPLPPLKTPLAQRNLLSAAATAQTITPERLLMAMTDAFATARDAVLAVEAAWERWEPILGALQSKERSLREQVDALGLTVPPELETVRRQIDDLQKRVASDPLGITGNVERALSSALSAARTAIEGNRRERETAAERLLAARRLLQELMELEAAANHAFAACQEVLDATQTNSASSCLPQLKEWLGSLETAAHEKRWRAIEIGLPHFMEAAQAARAQLVQAQKHNEALLDLPSELHGRHTVLRARMQQMKSTDATLERLALQVKSLLDQPRIPVERATKLMEACEQRLRRETMGVDKK